MAHINKKILIAEATTAARRASLVVTDPGVIKAAQQAQTDFLQFARTAHLLINESQAAWRRSA